MSGFVELGRAEIERTIPDRFEEQVALHADRPAFAGGGHALTYRDLDRAANGVAHAVLERARGGGGDGDLDGPVALLLGGRAGPELAALLGVLKAGRAYVPLDPAHPRARLAELVEDARAPLVIADRASAAIARDVAGEARPVLELETVPPASAPPPRAITPASPAYLLYTSGSTGQPKGVLHSHRNVLHTLRNWTNGARIGPLDRISVLHSIAVGASTAGNLGALLNGAALVPCDVAKAGLAGLAGFLAREEVTILVLFSTLFRQFASTLPDGADLSRLRVVRLGGDAAVPGDVALFQQRFPRGAILANWFGASETHGICRFFIDHATKLEGERVPIGTPVDGVEVRLLDPSGEEVGSGQTGEIVVRSPYLALGYWRRPDLTAQAFREAPGAPGVRAYRTGDLGRRAPDGCILYAGRADDQVKIRGFRVELGEVEAALLRHPAVREAAVTARDGPAPGEKRLAAYAVLRPEAPPLASTDLARFLRERLPDPMVPGDFVFLERLPFTPGGKVDRRALPAPAPAVARRHAGLRARDPLRRQIAEIWEEMLGLPPEIDIRESFFDLGGHSLLAVTMLARVGRLVGAEVPVVAFFEQPTIDHLAAVILRSAETPPVPITCLREGPASKAAVFFQHGDFDGGGFYCRSLFRDLEADRPTYILHPHPLGGPATVKEMARAYVRLIREARPRGPYLIGGWCNGGVIAFEIARLLRAAGERVPLVFILDARLPNAAVARLSHVFVPKLGSVARARWKSLLVYARGEVARVRGAGRPLDALSGRFRRLGGALADAFLTTWTDRGSFEHWRWVYHIRASRSYAPARYPGRVTLLRPANRDRDPTSGFGRFAAEVDVRVVPGGHVTMLTKHVAALAAELGALVRENG